MKIATAVEIGTRPNPSNNGYARLCILWACRLRGRTEQQDQGQEPPDPQRCNRPAGPWGKGTGFAGCGS